MLELDSATFNVVLGAVITICSTMAAWALLHFNQRRVERDRTRRTILHEVDHIENNIHKHIDLDTGKVIDHNVDQVLIVLSPDILEDDFHQIKKLTSPEVRSIYEFYESSRVLKRKLRRQESGDEIDDFGVKHTAQKIVDKQEEVHQNVRRSRLSLLTEWFKELDRQFRDRRQ